MKPFCLDVELTKWTKPVREVELINYIHEAEKLVFLGGGTEPLGEVILRNGTVQLPICRELTNYVRLTS